jgi:IS5 family transposase
MSRPPIARGRIPRTYFLQQWFSPADAAPWDWIYDSQVFRNFLRSDLRRQTMADATTLGGLHHWLEEGDLGKAGARSRHERG